jgi:hypothetical protein
VFLSKAFHVWESTNRRGAYVAARGSSVGRMCACHDPVVFGHRCKNEDTGGCYSSPDAVQDALDMLDVIKDVLMGLRT